MTQVILGPNESVKFQAPCATSAGDKTFFNFYLLSLTNKRVFAEDENGTLAFNYYLKDIDRAEIDKSFWKGVRVRLVLHNGNNLLMRVLKQKGVEEDAAASQRLINMINQVILVMRHQAQTMAQ